jgi:mono/diheme cytochrome c family protein
MSSLTLAGLACSGEDPEVAEGRALYEAHCMSCHGEGLTGDGPLASQLPVQPPSILEHLGHHTQAQLVQLIAGGIPPAMPPSPLDAAQVQLIVDYAWTRVPESEVAALRAMQQQMEEMATTGDSAASSMPGMDH